MGADVLATDNRGNSALSMALSATHSDDLQAIAASEQLHVPHASAPRRERMAAIAGLLLKSGASSSAQSLTIHKAAHDGRTDVLAFLLEQASSKSLVNSPAKDNMTPLHYAAQAGHALAAQILLDHGADPNARINSTVRCTMFVVHSDPVIHDSCLTCVRSAFAAGSDTAHAGEQIFIIQ